MRSQVSAKNRESATAGFVHGLKELKPAQRVRGSKALEGEASGSSWNGPL